MIRVIHADEIEEVNDAFKILETTDRSQIAVMVLKEGQTSGKVNTDHPQSDQILIVLEGTGSVQVEEEVTDLKTGDVAIIPAGAKHQVRGPNRTLSVYAPVAYPEDA